MQWAEIRWENGEMPIQFYRNPHSQYWEFPVENAIYVLEKAKNLLLEYGINHKLLC